jgi:hypothetical protein
MSYGTVKVDNITFTVAGVDQTVTVSGLARNPTISGNLTVTGTISGVTVTGTNAQFTTITGISGVFTTSVSGATVTGTNFGVGTGGIRFSDGSTQTAAVSTSNFATLTGAQTFTGGQRGAVVVQSYSTGIALDFSSGTNFQITLTGNTTLQNPTNVSSGQGGIITVIQGTGNNTMAFGSNWNYPGGSGSVPAITTTSGAVDLIAYYTRSTTNIAFRLIQNVKA